MGDNVLTRFADLIFFPLTLGSQTSPVEAAFTPSSPRPSIRRPAANDDLPPLPATPGDSYNSSWLSSGASNYESSESETWSNASTYSEESLSQSRADWDSEGERSRSRSSSRSTSRALRVRQDGQAAPTEAADQVNELDSNRRRQRKRRNRRKHRNPKDQQKDEQQHSDEQEEYYDAEEGDDVVADSPVLPPVPLEPFRNQVGGHSSIYKFTKRAVCKVTYQGFPSVRRWNRTNKVSSQLILNSPSYPERTCFTRLWNARHLLYWPTFPAISV